MEFVTGFAACVKYHTSQWSTRVYDEVANFKNAEPHVAPELEANDSLKLRIREAEEENVRRLQSSRDKVTNREAELKEKRRNYALTAKPMLEQYDDLSLSKHYYGELSNVVGSQEYGAAQLQSKETGSYGYQSKKLISLGLTLESLRCNLTEGRPFARELNVLVEDSETPDIAIVSAPLQAVASVGLSTRSDMRRAAFTLARAMEDAGKYNATASAQGWFDSFKFRTVTKPNVSQAQKMKEAMAYDAAKMLLAYVDKDDWAGALTLADKKFQNMTTADTSSGTSYAAALEDFKRKASPHVAAKQFLQYSESSLATARLAFVEDVLKAK